MILLHATATDAIKYITDTGLATAHIDPHQGGLVVTYHDGYQKVIIWGKQVRITRQ